MAIQTPYCLFLGDASDQLAGKMADGIRYWRPEICLCQFRMPGCRANLGLPDTTIMQAVKLGVKTLVVGVVNRGGTMSSGWIKIFVEALEAGLDIASGLHILLRDQPELVKAAKKHGRELHDVRIPKGPFPVANGRRRSGKRCLAVGTDCSVGKMFTMLAMERELHRRGLNATFRATGQTAILIKGDGVPLDAVVSDFAAGAIESLTLDNDPDHWDLVEGQGSLFHPSYAGVTMALIHGSQPDALVLCHEPTRTHMRGLPAFPLPHLEDLRDLSLKVAQLVNQSCKVIGVAINTAEIGDESAADEYLKMVERRLGLVTVDPCRSGIERLVDCLLETEKRNWRKSSSVSVTHVVQPAMARVAHRRLK